MSSRRPTSRPSIKPGATRYGILAPAGISHDIVNRLNAEWVRIAAMPDTKGKIKKALDAEPLSSTPDQFGEFIKKETIRGPNSSGTPIFRPLIRPRSSGHTGEHGPIQSQGSLFCNFSEIFGDLLREA